MDFRSYIGPELMRLWMDRAQSAGIEAGSDREAMGKTVLNKYLENSST